MLASLQSHVQLEDTARCLDKKTLRKGESHAGLGAIAERGQDEPKEQQSPAEASSEPQTREELVDSEYGGGQDAEPLRPASAGDGSYLFAG